MDRTNAKIAVTLAMKKPLSDLVVYIIADVFHHIRFILPYSFRISHSKLIKVQIY